MNGDGTMVWWADYEAFGKPKGVEGPDGGAVEEVPRFTGKAWDDKIGLYYFNARWYDPKLGRFTSEDSLGSNESTPFMYCLNNPITYFDGDGHAPTISYPIPWPDNYEVPADDWCRFDIDMNKGVTLVSIRDSHIPSPGIHLPDNDEEEKSNGNVDLLNTLAYQAFITPEFQPGYDGKTHCNQAAGWIAKGMGIPDNLYGMGAYRQEEYCLNPANGWVEITSRQAQELANQGIFVIVLGIGHAAVVVPGPGVDYPGGFFYPSVVSMGTAMLYGHTEKGTANWCFDVDKIKEGKVHYFYKPGITVPVGVSGPINNSWSYGIGIGVRINTAVNEYIK